MTLTAKIMLDGNLRITADEETQKKLLIEQKENKDFETEEFLWETFEELLANSPLDWVSAEDVGALTSAPIIGIYDDAIPVPNGGCGVTGRLVGSWTDDDGVIRDWIEPVCAYWYYPDYATKTPQQQLAVQGYCEFHKGA